MAKQTKKSIQQLASLRLRTKAPVVFKDKKKERDLKACRGKVDKCSKDYT